MEDTAEESIRAFCLSLHSSSLLAAAAELVLAEAGAKASFISHNALKTAGTVNRFVYSSLGTVPAFICTYIEPKKSFAFCSLSS
jgi:hypothetical protein